MVIKALTELAVAAVEQVTLGSGGSGIVVVRYKIGSVHLLQKQLVVD